MNSISRAFWTGFIEGMGWAHLMVVFPLLGGIALAMLVQSC
jgi:hypothetical protein